MSEQALWHHIREQMKGQGGHWHRVENLLDRGTPDVDWACWGHEGWIELKELPEWPKRNLTIVRLPHYSDDQRRWIGERGRAGGSVHLMLRIARPRTYLLFAWRTALTVVGNSTRMILERHALVCDGPAFPLEAIKTALCKGAM